MDERGAAQAFSQTYMPWNGLKTVYVADEV